MAQVRCLFFASLRDAAGQGKATLEWTETAPLSKFLDLLEEQFPKLQPFRGHYQVAIDQEMAESEALVQPGAEVALIPPVSGGSPVHQVRVTPEPLDLNAAFEQVSHLGCGAINIFAGTVRNYAGPDPLGPSVSTIDYSAYESMAEKSMQQLAEQAAERFPVQKTVLWHRTGPVAAGQASVVVAVATPHRAESFEACQWLIDQLKKLVPIWKKEIGPHGSVWIEGDARVPSL